MIFKFKQHDFFLKNLDYKYIYLFSKKTKKEYLLSYSFFNFLNQNDFDTSLLGLNAQNEHNLVAMIKGYPEIFDCNIDVSNNSLESNVADKTLENIDYKILYPYFMHRPKPWGLMVETTTNCNLRCSHCYNSNRQENIDIALLEKTIDLINPNDNLSVTLTGGEVFCHPQIKEIVHLLSKKEKVINFLTNAIAINDETINWLNNYKDYINFFQISLYSTNSSIHDEITNTRGSFEKTFNAILKLKNAGFKVILATLVVPKNTANIQSLIELSREYNIPINFCFKCISNCDSPSLNNSSDLSITEFTASYTAYLSCIKNFQHIEESLCGDYVCTAGYNKCVLGVNGDLFLCPTWKRDDFINVKSISDFNDFWFSKKVRNIRDVNRKDFDECQDCEAKKYCHPCMADNYNKNHSIFKLNTSHCELMKEKFRIDMLRVQNDLDK